MKKTLLLSMPFGALERQALGLSLLKASLTELNIACDVRYLTFTFAEFIGYEEYQWMVFEVPYTAFAGDWTFTHTLYGAHQESEKAYIEEVLCGTWRLDRSAIDRILRIRTLSLHFLDYCLAAIPWEEYAIVGFTSTFEQNIASLSLARRIKAAYPDITLVFGGANWEAEMGIELQRQFPFVDYVCSGEAERSFSALAQQVLTGKTVECLDTPIPGITYRLEPGLVSTHELKPSATEMDALPIPDYSDYFQDLEQSTVAAFVVPTLLFETSRGCWWGAKSHCTFCGLNGGTMAFRSKSARRALKELAYLVDRWQMDSVEVVDNILDMQYFKDMLPALAREGRALHMFYEVKANLTREHVRLLHEAGVHRIQPGIESLSDHVLKLMRKGTTVLQNIQLLKWCKEYNITVDWNILYGFPGETADDYSAMLKLLPLVRFFQPPVACGPIRLDRFSPYHNSPTMFGFTNVRPLTPYKYLYPFSSESLDKIAYYFDFDYMPDVTSINYAAEVISYVESWRRSPELGALRAVSKSDGTLVLIDTRANAILPEFVFSGMDRAIYEFCDSFHSSAAVLRYLHRAFPFVQCTEHEVLDFLESLVANKLMVTDGLSYLSLAIRVPNL
jgi:ribosomal peptide maturation radical SAM protein 1